MKCRFCGSTNRNNDRYCANCGKALSQDPGSGDEFSDGSHSGGAASHPSKSKRKKVSLIKIISIIVAILCLLGMCSDPDEDDPGQASPESNQQQEKQPSEEEPAELLWPDLRSYLGSGNYTTVTDTSRVKLGGEANEGKIAWMYEIRISRDQEDRLETFLELVENSHFELEEIRDTDDGSRFYFYRFKGSNAPDPGYSKEAAYHGMIAIAEKNENTMLIRSSWLDAFEPDKTVGANQSPIEDTHKPKDEETQPAKPENTEPETQPKETQPKETQPQKPAGNTNNMSLPDPAKFFGCARGEDHEHEGNNWILSCKFDIDTGKTVAAEYLALLESGDYPLERIYSEKLDFIRSSAQLFYRYYFNYSGNESGVEGMQGKINDGKQMLEYDVKLAIYHNYQAGWLMITLYFDNSFTLVDEGHRASVLPTDYTRTPDEDLPDFHTPNWNRDTQQCTGCDGTGDCAKCNGGGYLWSSASDSRDRNCWRCNNSGICQVCYGTGRR